MCVSVCVFVCECAVCDCIQCVRVMSACMRGRIRATVCAYMHVCALVIRPNLC